MMEKLISALVEQGIDLVLEQGKLKAKAKKGALTAEMTAQIAEHKQQLIRYLEQTDSLHNQVEQPLPPIVQVDTGTGLWPLSYAQQRLWFIDQINAGSTEYHMPMAFQVDASFDLVVADQVLREIVQRHEVLRTNYVAVDGVPYQRVRSEVTVGFRHIEIPVDTDSEQLQALLAAESVRAFDLSNDVLIRACIFERAGAVASEKVLLFVLHHIAADGWSLGILWREFGQLYHAYLQTTSLTLPTMRLQYKDYACWQREHLTGKFLARQRMYWQQQLAALPLTHHLPLLTERPEQKQTAAGLVTAQLDGNTAQRLLAIAADFRLTPFMLMHAMLALVLARHSNQQDVVIGTPVANRRQNELAGLIGFFTNTLVLRVDTGSPTIGDYLAKVRQCHLEAQSHQDLPFDMLVEQLQVTRSTAYTPLFQIMLTADEQFNLTHEISGAAHPEQKLFSALNTGVPPAKFDLQVDLTLSERGVSCQWLYDCSLFSDKQIQLMQANLQHLLHDMARYAAKDFTVLAAQGLTDLAKGPLTKDLEPTLPAYRNEDKADLTQSLQQQITAQALAHPDKIAVSDLNSHWSYRQLNEQSNQFAQYLRECHQIGEGDVVVVGMMPCYEMVLAILAVLKSGAAYLVIEPTTNPERQLVILQQVEPALFICLQQTQHQVIPVTVDVVNMLADWAVISNYTATPLPESDDTTQSAAARTLSGVASVVCLADSVDGPLAAAVSQQQLATYCTFALGHYYSAHCQGVWVADSVQAEPATLLLPLLAGDTLTICPADSALETLAQCLSTGSVAPFLIQLSAARLKLLLALLPTQPLSQKLTLVTDAQQASPELLDAVSGSLPASRIYVQYGTATAITGRAVLAYQQLAQREQHHLPLGPVMANTELLILNDDLMLSPTGTIGELYVCSDDLSSGYPYNPAATCEHFVELPAWGPNGVGSRRLFKTGDWARCNEAGQIELMGRRQQPLKFRGLWLHPRLIEQTINNHPLVHSCRITVETTHSVESLLAFIRLQPANAADDITQQLQQWLQGSLPAHQIPQRYVVVSELPSGRPVQQADTQPAAAVAQLSTPQQVLLANIWRQLLQVPQVGPADRFFALGGHSLLAVSLISHLEKSGYQISLKEVYRSANLAEMAAAMQPVSAVITDQSAVEVGGVPLDCKQLLPSMFRFVQLEQDSLDWIASQVPGGSINVQDIYPLLGLQTGILYHHLLDAEHDPYRQSSELVLHSQTALTELVAAINAVICRHDLLRCCVISDLPVPVAVILRQIELPVFHFELTGTDSISQQLQQRSVLRLNRLDQAPLLNLDVGRDPDSGQFHAILTFHHLIIDHVGLEILLREIAMYRTGQLAQLPAPIPYSHFVADLLSRSQQQNSSAFFREMLAGFTEPVMPFSVEDVRGVATITEIAFQLPDALTCQVRQLAATHNVSAASFFHLAFALMLQRLTGRADVVFATVLSGRQQGIDGREHSVGMFLNSLPLRVSLADTAVAMLMQVHDNLIALLEHEQCPLSVAIAASEVNSAIPLFTTVLNYRHSRFSPAAEVASMHDIELVRTTERTNYPLSLGVTDVTGEATDLFHLSLKLHPLVDQATVVNTLNYCLSALASLLTDRPTQPVMQLLLPRENTVSSTAAAVVVANPIELASLFLQTVQQSPAQVALCFEESRLTYAELAVKVVSRAGQMQAHGIRRGDKVALCLHRSVDMAVAMLATLLTGASYVPLEPAWPAERLRFILQDAEVTLVLTESAVLEMQPCLQAFRLLVSAEAPASAAEYTPVLIEPTDLAYIIYTSGTTGQPKGVLVSHSNVLSFQRGFACQLEALGLQPKDSWLWNASYAFDASVKALVALLTGRPVVLTNQAQNKDAFALVALMRRHGVKVFNSVPAMVEQVASILLEQAHSSVQLISSGEDISPRIWQRLLAYSQQTGQQVLNAYGPTETTVNACFGVVDAADNVNMGRPLPGCVCYILDHEMQPVPAGTIGELYVGGPNVAMGYLNRPEQTAASFVVSPFAQDVGGTLYKTGDLVRLTEQGNLVFCGRVDHQVKIRGFRIELEEIERALSSAAAAVTQAVVLVQESSNGSKWLSAFVQSEIDLAPSVLRQHLERMLPDYMVPEHFSVLPVLPVLSSGKIDRAALLQAAVQPKSDQSKPSNDTEATLCGIWQQILGLENVGIHDDFFMLGGDSILSMQVVAQARRKQLNISIRQLLSARTIAGLAALLTTSVQRSVSQRPVRGEQILLPVQQQFFADLTDSGAHFNQSLFVELPLGATPAVVEQFVAALINRHDVFRLAFNQADLGHWQAKYKRSEELPGVSVQVVAMAAVAATDHNAEIRRHADAAHASFNLASGQLLQVLYFDYGTGQTSRLLLIAHHLVVDGVSWRVIAADLEFWLQQTTAGSAARLPEKSVSYQEWARFLRDYCRGSAFGEEMAYWQRQCQRICEELPVLPLNRTTRSALPDWQSSQFNLSAADTSYLLNIIPKIWECDSNEILLSALLIAWRQWLQRTTLPILMEGHGREALPDAPDVSETVGWFTSKYPLLLSCAETEPAKIIDAVKQQYRAMPSKGLGFGLARYLAEPVLAEQVDVTSLLQFNYLGSFDSSFSAETSLKPVPGHSGEPVSASYLPKHAMNLTGMVWQRKLTFRFSYCCNRLSEPQVAELMACYQAALQQIITASRQTWSEHQAMSYLGSSLEQTELSQIVLQLNQSSAAVRLFCAPPVSGTSLVYQALARELSEVVSCYGLQLPDLYTDIRTETVSGLAAFYCAVIKRLQPVGPYLLLGWSSGGTVAYEIARQLAMQGEQVRYLALLDQPLRQQGTQRGLWQHNPYFKIEGLYGSKLSVDWEQVRQLPAEQALPLLVEQACLQGLKPDDADERMMLRHFDALVSFPQVMDAFEASSSAVPMSIFNAEASEQSDPRLGWEQVCSATITTVPVPGAHQNMVYPPFVAELANQIKQQLNNGGDEC